MKSLKNASLQNLKQTVSRSENRIAEIDRMMIRIYEDNVSGRISDERFFTMRDQYEAEQSDLKAKLKADRAELTKAESKKEDMRFLLKTIRERTDSNALTPSLVNSLIERIEIHNPEKINGHKRVQVDIYFTGIGMFGIPDKTEMIPLSDTRIFDSTCSA